MRFDRLDRARLLPTFLEAFSDYAMDVSGITEEMKRIRATKNNVDWDLSVGVFVRNRMVAFTMIAVDDWQGRLTAFDATTGVVPEHRGRRLAGRMLEHAMPALRQQGVTRFALEVLQSNAPAIRAYKSVGFEVTRELACLALDLSKAPAPAAAPDKVEIIPVDREVVAGFAGELDWEPSWENSLAAVARIPDELIVLGARQDGEYVGTLAYTPALKSLMTLLVGRRHRRRGIGTALVHELIARLPAGLPALRLLNVQCDDAGMLAFLERNGFVRLVDQYEMARDL